MNLKAMGLNSNFQKITLVTCFNQIMLHFYVLFYTTNILAIQKLKLLIQIYLSRNNIFKSI